jgi:hypothetical protein
MSTPYHDEEALSRVYDEYVSKKDNEVLFGVRSAH